MRNDGKLEVVDIKLSVAGQDFAICYRDFGTRLAAELDCVNATLLLGEADVGPETVERYEG